MKTFILSFIAFVLAGTVPLVAKESYSQPGSATVQLGLGPSWGNGGGLNLQGGGDWGLGQVSLAPEVPLDLGVAGRVGAFSLTGLTAAAFGTVHYSWKFLGSKWEWLNQMETYVGLGVQILPGLFPAGYFGADYHFDSHWAVFLEASSLNYASTVLGASYKF